MDGILSRIKSIFRKRGSLKSKSVRKLLTSEQFTELERIIGYQIKDQSHYVQALIHRSFLEELDEDDASNERLEFLGDAVLSLVTAEYLFHLYPDKDEGFLTKVRAKIVNRNSLAESAEEIGLVKFLLINQNLSNTFSRGAKTVLSDAFEALVGALYLDQGLEACRVFIRKVLIDPIVEAGEHLIDENYKSQLLEYAQANKLDLPDYRVVKEEGPQHDRIFTVQVSVGDNIIGIGKGKNKKTAEQNAAKKAMEKIHKSQ
ncbi:MULTISPECIES: ribonuclease III [Ignavibacterium]|uniref:ribonuclease III n=1 Tax=Ignavibacterium TaxID=795750 RepID=UPI0025BBA03C|nr:MULTISPECIES: ribonuclease III [Ignavibacterium]MBI5663145.1 ribonuclease III [Ignavibacterium album]